MIDQIRWLGHGSFVIQGTPLIYINPWRIAGTDTSADVILLSDEHYSHCSPADIRKLRRSHTQIIGSSRAAQEIEGCAVLRPWQSVTIGRACIKAVPADSGRPLHGELNSSGLGFLISANYYDIYYAGDTHPTPDMAAMHPDIAILPINGRDTMTVDEAAEATRQLRPRWVIPFNWGSGSGDTTRMEALMFAERVGSAAEVLLLDRQMAV